MKARVNKRLIKAFRFMKRLTFQCMPAVLIGPIYALVNGSIFKKVQFSMYRQGEGAYLDPSVQVIGWRWVKLGDRSLVSENTWIVINHRNQANRGVIIRDDCHIGRNNFFSCGPSIELSSYVMTSVGCKFLGAGHVIEDPREAYVYAPPSDGAPIRVGVNCWLGASVTVLGGVNIGHGSIIGANSLVTSDIPPFSIAVGAPCRVIKRFDFIVGKWVRSWEFDADSEKWMPAEDAYLASLIAAQSGTRRSLISSGKRFGWI